jgi:hypothetical protein
MGIGNKQPKGSTVFGFRAREKWKAGHPAINDRRSRQTAQAGTSIRDESVDWEKKGFVFNKARRTIELVFEAFLIKGLRAASRQHSHALKYLSSRSGLGFGFRWRREREWRFCGRVLDNGGICLSISATIRLNNSQRADWHHASCSGV